jgi:hypothetical protein
MMVEEHLYVICTWSAHLAIFNGICNNAITANIDTEHAHLKQPLMFSTWLLAGQRPSPGRSEKSVTRIAPTFAIKLSKVLANLNYAE